MIAVRLTCSRQLEHHGGQQQQNFSVSMAGLMLVCGALLTRGRVLHASGAGAGAMAWCRPSSHLDPHSLEPDPPPHKHATLSPRAIGQAGPRGRPQEAD